MANITRQIVKAVLLAGIAVRKSVLPVGVCRFHPTCSEYAIQAFSELGLLKAARCVAWRLLRCNPLCTGGNDPVPGPVSPTMGKT
jgi:uncharacterized protein